MLLDQNLTFLRQCIEFSSILLFANPLEAFEAVTTT